MKKDADKSSSTISTTSQPVQNAGVSKTDNPLSNKQLYVDMNRTVNKTAAQYRKDGKPAEAGLLDKIATQPGTTWLTGPSSGDPTANRDIAEVARTSKEAAAAGTVPVYQLYAISNRDACASYSKGGFSTTANYLAWIDRILGALQSAAIFSVEADAVAHTINSSCMTAQQIGSRYALLSQATARLSQSPRVLAVYIDAGHPDWLPDPSVLVEPLRKSGIEHVRGVVVNVSFFAETAAVTKWSQTLVEKLGGNKGVLIDTSRNGKGIANATGDARWCNPPGRGLGPRPTTVVADAAIDAYFWGKNAGESDGNCFGNPAAGVFVPRIALELARNATE
jgi:endoglucanase